MRKIFSVFFMIAGIILISTSVFLQLDLGNDSSQENKKQQKENKKEDTFKPLNKFNLEEVCNLEEKVSTYINLSDYTKISFDYPSCVHEYELSFWYKFLDSEEKDIKIQISSDKESVNNYINQAKTKLIALGNEKNYEMYYTDKAEITTKKGIKATLIQATYKYKSVVSTYVYDKWYIATQIDENQILKYEIEAKEKRISLKTIEDMIDSIKIEKNKATFKNSKQEGEYQIGSIRQNKYKTYNHGYIVNYKVSNKYPEVEAIGSDINESIFELEDTSKSTYVSMTLETSSYDDFKEEVEMYHKSAFNSYNDYPDKYKNIKDTGVINKQIKNKNIYYFIVSSDYYIEDEKAATRSTSYVYYEVEPSFYLKIYISNKNSDITEEMIEEFLNFTIEEY